MNLYISDYYNNKIRLITSTGIVSTFAGTGIQGSSGDGGQASLAQLYLPVRMSVDISGTVYIPDSGNNKIRVVNSAGIITTFAGTGTAGNGGDGGPATSASFNNPSAAVSDISGNVYIADYTNNVIRVVIKSPPAPTSSPTISPSSPPTISPTPSPSLFPTLLPTAKPLTTAYPTTAIPTHQPSSRPTSLPSINSYGSTLVATYNFETILSTSTYSIIQTNGGTATIAGWTIAVTPTTQTIGGSEIVIVSYQNNIGFASPFPNNHHYMCSFLNSLSTLSTSSITRSITNTMVGSAYSISFWYVCRSNYACQKDFSVVLDGITVYSTPPTLFSWKNVVLANCYTATSTSMALTFRSSNTGQLTSVNSMGIDQISVWMGAANIPTRTPTTATPSYTPTSAAPSTAAPTHQPTSRPTSTPSINAKSLAPIPINQQLPSVSVSIVQVCRVYIALLPLFLLLKIILNLCCSFISQTLNIDYTTIVAPNVAQYVHNFRLAVSECLKLDISTISAVSFAVTGNIRRSLLAGTTTARYTVTMASSNRNALQTAVTQVSSTDGTLSTVLSQKTGQSITVAVPVFLTDAPTSHPSSGPTSQPTQPTGQPTSFPSCGLGHHGLGSHGHGCGICDAGSIPAYLGSDVCNACPVNTYQPLSGSAHCMTCPYPFVNFIPGETKCQGFCACLYGTPIAIVMSVLLITFVGGLAPAGQGGYVMLAVVFFPSLDFFSDIAYLMTNAFYDPSIFVIGWIFVSIPIPIFIRTLVKEQALCPCFMPWTLGDVMFLQYEGHEEDRFYFPAYRSKHDRQKRPLFPFLSQHDHSQIHLVVMEFLAWIFAIALQLSVIPLWFFGSLFYAMMFLPFWLAMGCVFHATKVIAVGAVWNLWFRVWTCSDRNKTDVVVDTKQLNECLCHEFLYESLPQV